MLQKKEKICFSFSILILIISFLSIPVTLSNLSTEESSAITQGINNKSIILMIGDGMGFEHIELANLVEFGFTDNLTLEKLPYYASVRTDNIRNQTTDSAAAATAMATGYKTEDGYLGLNADEEKVDNIVEVAQKLGKSTGIVATATVGHATPAGFMTHINSRYNYDEIYSQIVESNVDILLGGGSDYFTSEMINTLLSYGYNLTYTREELLTLNSSRLMGLFYGGHLPEEEYRKTTLIPSLAEMTSKALELLSFNNDGFFLMVEGSQIDWGGHDNDPIYVALETIAFDYAVKVAYEYVQTHEDTILIVTSDHETGGLKVISNTLDDTLPMDFENEEEILNQRITRVNNIVVSWASSDHTSINVPLYIYGESFNDIEKGILIENTDIFNIMNQTFYGLPISITDITPPPSTEESSYLISGMLIPLFSIQIILTIEKRRRNKNIN